MNFYDFLHVLRETSHLHDLDHVSPASAQMQEIYHLRSHV